MSIDTDFSGSTGVFGVLRGRTLYVCNVGDSRVILGKTASAVGGGGRVSGGGPMTVETISIDHKADIPAEKSRIEKCGGEVRCEIVDDGEVGPARVFLRGSNIPGLAMSRSLGDTVSKTAGVISVPQTHTVYLESHHTVLVWASDGLWEFCSNAEVLDMVERELAKSQKDGSSMGHSEGGGGIGGGTSCAPLKAISEKLVAESNLRWMQRECGTIDDTSCILVTLSVKA